MKSLLKYSFLGTSLVIQCYDSPLSIQEVWIQTLVRELRSHKATQYALPQKNTPLFSNFISMKDQIFFTYFIQKKKKYYN